MFRRGFRFGLASLSSLTVFAIGGLAQSPVRPLITSRVDENTLVTLRGNTRAEAIPENDRGRLDDATRIEHMFSCCSVLPSGNRRWSR